MRAPRSILIADDNRDWTESLAAILRGAGHTVHTANDGREALETAARVSPDVVILDIGMPRLTGYEAARVFDRAKGARPVLIAVTAWGRESDRLRAQLSGFDHHFTKPAEPEAILRLLESLPSEPPKA